MSNKKQTAVEWLEENLDVDIRLFIHCKDVFEQAKEMEKQQIIDADVNGSIRTAKAIDYRITQLRIKELAEQYYNETFKNNPDCKVKCYKYYENKHTNSKRR